MRRSVLLGALAALSLGSAASAVTVPDFSFETPSTSSYIYNPTVAGVTFNAGSGIQHNGSDWGFANAPDGVQTAFIQSTSNYTGSISISLSDLVVGQLYQVTFAGAARPNYAADPLTVSFGGTQIGAYTITQNGWLDYSTATFKATSVTGSLIFLGTATSGDTDLGLDKIRVGAVPEPAIWAMMIIGFGSVGVMLRRNRALFRLV